MRTTIAATVVIAAALSGLGAAYVVAGVQGLLVVGLALAGLAALASRLALPPTLPAPRRTRWRIGRRARGPDGRNFPAYRRIGNALGWAGMSARHYDHQVRPLLARLLAATLADRHGIDPVRQPDRARELVGDELWPLLDDSRPRSIDSATRGVDLATLTRIVDRLEELAGGRVTSGETSRTRQRERRAP